MTTETTTHLGAEAPAAVTTDSAAPMPDAEDFGQVIAAHERMLYAIAWSRLGDEHLSEEAVQETFLLAWQHRHALRDRDRLAAWLAAIVRRTATRLAKRSKREASVLHEWSRTIAPAAGPGESGSAVAELDQALAALPGTLREVLTVYYVENQSAAEGARRLGITSGAFKTRLHRARQALRSEYTALLDAGAGRVKPSPALKGRILGAVPLLPDGGTLPAGLLGAVAAKLLPLALQIGVTFGLVAWFQRGVVRNYRSQGEVRRQIMRHNFWVLVPTVAILAGPVMLYGIQKFGVSAVYFAMGLMLVGAAIQAFRQYRMGPNRWSLAVAAGTPALAAAFLAVPGFGLPAPWVMAAFLPYNLLLAWARRDMPLRNDYNLFLRAAMGTLGAGGTSQSARVRPGAVRGWVQTLGSRFLVLGTTHAGDAVRLYLPSIFLSPRQVIQVPHAWAGLSVLDVDPDGRCRAHLARRDRRALQRLFGFAADTEAWQRDVETAVAASLAAFAAGHPDAALRCVEAEDDAQVLERPSGELPATRRMFTISVVAAALLVLLLLLQALLPGLR